MLGERLYRLIHQGRLGPWEIPEDAHAMPAGAPQKRPEGLAWLSVLCPLRARWCACGRLHEVYWQRGYTCRILYPKPPFVGMCKSCFEAKRDTFAV